MRTSAKKSFALWPCCWRRSPTVRNGSRRPSHSCSESIVQVRRTKKMRDRKMSEIPVNIIEFVEHPDLIGYRSLSRAQKSFLKSVYGLPVDPEELRIYQRATGREIYDPREQK